MSLRGVSKSYGVIDALSDVSLEVRAGEVVGLCGHNGAGKSTLVKIISGAERPDAGTLEVAGRECFFDSPRQAQAAGVSVVDQELSVAPALSVQENLELGSLGSRLRKQRINSADVLGRVGLSHVDPRLPVARLAMAERQLVEIARGLARGSKLLVLDEPTATLSDVEIARVFTAVRGLAATGCGIVFVSHRLGEVLDLSDRVDVLRNGVQVASVETPRLSREALVELMIGKLAPPVARHRVREGAEEEDGGLQFEMSVPDRLERVAQQMRPGSVYALAGQVGSGASVLLRALAGLEPDARGTVRLAGREIPIRSPQRVTNAGIAFISSDRKEEGLFIDRSVRANLVATRLSRLARGGLLRPRRVQGAARAAATAAGVDQSRLPRRVRDLSGGNQQKVFIGRCLDREDIRVLLLDEPTRGVDVGGRAEIHQLIRDAADDGLIVVFASTELDELLELADQVITMRSGRTIGRHRAGVTGATILADMTHAERGR